MIMTSTRRNSEGIALAYDGLKVVSTNEITPGDMGSAGIAAALPEASVAVWGNPWCRI